MKKTLKNTIIGISLAVFVSWLGFGMYVAVKHPPRISNFGHGESFGSPQFNLLTNK